MKKTSTRCAALLLAAALVFSLAQPALASDALGSELSQRATPLGTGTTLTTQSLWSASMSDLRTEHYVTYSPNATVKPVVFSGNYVVSTNTVSTAAAQLESRGYRVAAALNGGFFNSDGTIVGMLMTDGVVRSIDVQNYTMVGFTRDGRVFLDESKPVMSASWTAVETVYPDPETIIDPETGAEVLVPQEPVTVSAPRSFPVAGFNAYRNGNYLGGLYLYNRDFATRVTPLGASVSAILRPLEAGEMKMSGTMTFEVLSVTDTAQEGVSFQSTIPEGCYMLYGEDHNNAQLLDSLRALSVGGQVTFTIGGASAQWADALYGVSGLYTLLRDGQVVSGLPTAANPYTAVGVKASGEAVFYTIDGRQSGYSVGATYAQVAQRLQELGCVSAVALDGGGSTTLGATLPGSGGFAVVNRPSGGSERRVNNTIALVSEAGAPILTPGAYVTAPEQVVLAGSSLSLTAKAYDSAGDPLERQYLTWSADGGTVSGNGATATYTAGNTAGVYAVSAGGAGVNVRVVDRLTGLTVSRKDGSQVASLRLKPGDQVDLTAAGAWWNLPVAMDREHISWSCAEGIGSIDENGRFTAGYGSQGSITVSAGGLSVTVPVTVDNGCPYVDVAGHWCQEYVVQLYQLGLTSGGGVNAAGQPVYRPGDTVTRAQMMVFLTRLLGIRAEAYDSITLPFEDQGDIPSWALSSMKAMYSTQVLKGSGYYCDPNRSVTREEAMTFLSRVLQAQERFDLGAFSDGGTVSGWARSGVETLVALDVVGGSNGMLYPKTSMDRAAMAKLLVKVFPMEKALLLPRLDLMMTAQ